MPNIYEIVDRGRGVLGWNLVSTDGVIIATNPIGPVEFNKVDQVKEAIRKVKKAGGSYTKIVDLTRSDRK